MSTAAENAPEGYPSILRQFLQALELGAHVLADDPAQLWAQMLGRLQGEPGNTLRAGSGRPPRLGPWLRPIRPSLAGAGGSLIRTFGDHRGAVRAIAVCGHGRLVASGDDQGVTLVWDLERGRVRHTLHCRAGAVVALAPRGDRNLVSAGADGAIQRWDIESGALLSTTWLDGANAMGLLPDGRTAVVAGRNGLEALDLETGARLSLAVENVAAVAATGPGRVAFAKGSSIWTWRLDEPEPTLLASPGAEATALATHDDRVLCGFRHTGRIDAYYQGATDQPAELRSIVGYEIEDGLEWLRLEGHGLWREQQASLYTTIGHFEGASVHAITIAPDGKRAVSGGEDRNVAVWDLITGQRVELFGGHERSVRALAMEPAGERVISGSDDGSIRVWRIGTEPQAKQTFHSDAVTAVALVSHESVVLSTGRDHRVLRWNAANGDALDALEDPVLQSNSYTIESFAPGRGPETVFALANASDVMGGFGACRMGWRVDQSRLGAFSFLPTWTAPWVGEERLTLKELPAALCRDGTRVVVAADSTGEAEVWDLERTSWAPVPPPGVLPPAPGADAAVVERDLVATWAQDHEVRGFAALPGSTVFRLEEKPGKRGWLRRRPAPEMPEDRHRLRVLVWDDALRVREILEGRLRLRLATPGGDRFGSMILTPEGRRLLSAHAGRLGFWNLETGELMQWIHGGRAPLAMTPDGRRGIAGYGAGGLRVWDLEAGRPLAAFRGDAAMSCAAIADDGRLLTAGDSAGKVHLLHVEAGLA